MNTVEIDKIASLTSVAIAKVVSDAVSGYMTDNTVWKEKFDWLESEVESWVKDAREIAEGFKSEGFTAKLVEAEAFLDASLYFQKMVKDIKESA